MLTYFNVFVQVVVGWLPKEKRSDAENEISRQWLNKIYIYKKKTET